MKFEKQTNSKGLVGRVYVEREDSVVAFPVWSTPAGFRFGFGERTRTRGGFVVRVPGTVDPETCPELSSDECLDAVIAGAGDVLKGS